MEDIIIQVKDGQLKIFKLVPVLFEENKTNKIMNPISKNIIEKLEENKTIVLTPTTRTVAPKTVKDILVPPVVPPVVPPQQNIAKGGKKTKFDKKILEILEQYSPIESGLQIRQRIKDMTGKVVPRASIYTWRWKQKKQSKTQPVKESNESVA